MKKLSALFGGLLLAATGASTVNAESIYVDVMEWDGNNYVPYAYGFNAELTKDENGVYTIDQFFNSGYPASFTFETPAVGQSSLIKMAGHIQTPEGGWPYLLDPDDENMICYCYQIDGTADDWWAIFWPYVDDKDGYSWVYRYDVTDPNNIYEYYGQICMTGQLQSGDWAPWLYLQFFFNEPEITGIANVNDDANAPVEYFDLQGRRIDNPSHGLYLRRQGSKTAKVIL